MFPPLPDFTRISFPTDRLTIAAIRKRYPKSVDLPHTREPLPRNFIGRSSLEVELGSLLDNERLIAAFRYKQVLGLPTTREEDYCASSEAKTLLAEEYVALGLAPGKQVARQLLRTIETQAAEQARQLLGGRPR